MPAEFEPVLPASEHLAVIDEWKRLQDAPPPRERREIAVVTALAGIVLWFVGPFLLLKLGVELPPGVRMAINVGLIAAILWGVFFGFILVSGRYSHARYKAEAAVTWLSENGAGGDPDERRRQAVTLLFHASCSDGPSTTNTIDFEKTRTHLGGALPYVIAVERALRSHAGIYPVFTDRASK